MGCTQATASDPAPAVAADRVAEIENQMASDNSTVGLHNEQALDPFVIADINRVFDLADGDKNGTLDVGELSRLRKSPEMAKAMMRKVDTDLSGTVSKDEWLAYFSKLFEWNEMAAAEILGLFESHIVGGKADRM
mmetsp:Transcript_119470/g.338773  ORF Transcript_119470/g.338773 Transcript_119470/m.338773 type:complete len:135 (+) Transcript_119470:94-498(+)|eukprot:CAMPEP_0179253844 /NCGR_PEP_ID=MMETSP0797-20121207/22941_1 /TAXON_ID=47934 /ORGANISM="Dinophysis acuminata, Strain DAEP01" /LENGTH=134 /DNA_ID=CAMNT_0020961721 /DNA_START=94 /DNA_END=498 /DNA_ORIENTATION=+